MHEKISVVVPTRHRKETVTAFKTTLFKSLEGCGGEFPQLTVLYDSPDSESTTCLDGEHTSGLIREVWVPDKSSLTELWNLGIILSPTDWVLICNDDIEIKPGWLEYLEKTIDTGDFDLFHLFHYGAMCMHKSMICKVGWFDETFEGGGYEDVDYQLRISEAGLKNRVDQSHAFMKREGSDGLHNFIVCEGNKEIGHFVDHTKHCYSQENNWQGRNNEHWIIKKWRTNLNFSLPSYRTALEIDWHPAMSRKYAGKFGALTYQSVGVHSMSFKLGIKA